MPQGLPPVTLGFLFLIVVFFELVIFKDTRVNGEGGNWLSDRIVIGNCILVLRGSCPDPDIRFFLSTKEGRGIEEEIIDGQLQSSTFNPRLPIKILVHGYRSDRTALDLIKQEYLRVPGVGYNVITIDWAPLCLLPCYPMGAYNTRFVGMCLARLIQQIRATNETSELHLIGFSLGAHVSARAAVALKPFVLPRITGLDPALPLFSPTPKDAHLDSSDAKFVDVLHTNALIQGRLARCGHVDTYANQVIFQPGCDNNPRCSHFRSVELFAESINSRRGFWTWPCSNLLYVLLNYCQWNETQDLLLFGENTDKSARGVRVLKTEDQAPYALGKPGSSNEDDVKCSMQLDFLRKQQTSLFLELIP